LTFLSTLLLTIRPARADITFDDLPSAPYGAPITNGYAGLSWSNFYVLDTAAYQPSGYVNGVVSGTNVAYNGNGSAAAISDGAFTLNSAYFTAAWNDGLNVAVQGFLNGNLAHSLAFTVGTSGPTLVTFNWLVDAVTFSSSGGSDNRAYGGSGTHFAMDNLRINEAVPEPSAILLLTTMLALVGCTFRFSLKRT
jgi:hypothetical protein